MRVGPWGPTGHNFITEFSAEILKMKCRRLKLWKPTVRVALSISMRLPKCSKSRSGSGPCSSRCARSRLGFLRSLNLLRSLGHPRSPLMNLLSSLGVLRCQQRGCGVSDGSRIALCGQIPIRGTWACTSWVRGGEHVRLRRHPGGGRHRGRQPGLS